MPSRNVLKDDVANSYYHIYARGANKSPIFLDENDKLFFTSLFKRYLSKNVTKNKTGQVYPNYHEKISLVAYCLMENHFHILIYQTEQKTMSGLMRAIMTSYSRYFNYKYKRTGPLFESRYKASHIDSSVYLDHISRYIHMNPRYWLRYKYSSLKYYLNDNSPEWLNPRPVLDLFESRGEYLEFLKQYQRHKSQIEEIKSELADH